MSWKVIGYTFCIVGGGVQTGSTRHVGHLLDYCTWPGWLWGWRIWWNKWQGKPKYSEKTCPGAIGYTYCRIAFRHEGKTTYWRTWSRSVSSLWCYRYNNLLVRLSFVKREYVCHYCIVSVIPDRANGCRSCGFSCISSNVRIHDQNILENIIKFKKEGEENKKCWHLIWASKTPKPVKICQITKTMQIRFMCYIKWQITNKTQFTM
jgi:hypothetical protein